MELLVSLILLLALIFLTLIFFIIIYALIFGAPYAPLSYNRIEVMVKLLGLKKNEVVADLGSGDGRIVIKFAELGFESHGYEINPVMILVSRWRIRRKKLQNKAFIHFGDFWHTNLKGFDAVTLYGISHMMGRLEKKLVRELKPGGRIVSNYFKFPNLKEVKSEDKVLLYILN